MKKSFFTLLLIVAAIMGLNAQTYFIVQGTVNNLNGQPVNEHQVFIASDSLNNPSGGGYYFNMVTTNPNGYFMDSIPFIAGTNMAFRIYTFDCNQAIHDTTVYSGIQQDMIDFNICDQATPACQAAFQAYADSASSQYLYHFTDYSAGIISQWIWSFGDGTSQTIVFPANPNISHYYANPGTYTVCLSISGADSLGCTSTWCDVVQVGNVPGCQAAFQAYTDSTGTHFIDYSVGNISNWTWFFGDPAGGSTNTSSLQNPTYVYTAPGVYTVCLTVSSGDSSGCTSVWCDNITIGNVPECQAAFQAYADSTGPLLYQFVDYSVGNISGWYWNFGDNMTSNLQNPQHTYAGPGVYNVCLSISSGDTLCSNTWCDTIVVGNSANCSSMFSYATSLMTATFEAISFGFSNPAYTWNFGDGTTGTGQNTTHSYPATGYYVVTLTTADSTYTGCTIVYSKQIYIGQQMGMIWGQVIAGNTFADHARVFLYVNSGGSNIFALMDSTTVDSSGYYQFTGINYNVVFLKAELLPTSAYYGEYMPTYFDSAMYWNEATGIVVWQPNNQYNIGLLSIAGIANTGNGAMNGTVAYGSGKGPVAQGIEVILLDASGNPLAYTYTDAAGWFSFANLGYDTYSVYVEMPGFTTSPATAALNATNSTATMVFIIGVNSIALSIEDNLPQGFKGIGYVFPNPVTNEAAIMIDLEHTTTFVLKVVNFTGSTMSAEELTKPSGQHKIILNTNQLPSGVYGLLITIPNGNGTLQKFLVVR